MNQSSCLEDYSFGPQTSPECRDGLDLTLVFEESMLSLLPAVLMIVASAVKVASLRNARKVVLGTSFQDTKMMTLILLVALRFALLLLWALRAPIRTQTSIAAAAVYVVESLAFLALSKAEHNHAIRPSSLLNLYLIFSIGLDFVRMRTLVKMDFDTLITSLSAAVLAAKLSLLFVEAQNKVMYFTAADIDRPPQETSGILSRSVFWWINSLFFHGHRGILKLDDLIHLDEELSSEETLARFEVRWLSMSNVHSYRLARTIVMSLTRLFLRPVIPNVLSMALTFSQPFLVSAILDFISSDDPEELGQLIVVAYAVVYISKAIFSAFYTHQLDRFATILRGCLVNIIYNKTLKVDLKEGASGESLTLMSADVERIVKGFGLIHETSSNGVMALVALGLLYRQLGLTFMAPLIFSAILSLATGAQSGPYIKRQKEWLEATEERVGLTASVISSMKGVKILGFVEKIHAKIRALRHEEVNRAKKVRVFMALFAILQTLSLSGTRWITYTVFGIVALLNPSNNSFGVNRLFTSLAILNIFMERLEIFLRQMPALASAFGCLRRIETFLLLEMKRDGRLEGSIGSFATSSSNENELQTLLPRHVAIKIDDLSVGWNGEIPILNGISMDITRGSFTMIIGPVGSGKSTLINALLGETVTHKGSIRLPVNVNGSIAYCAQTPWLVNKSIQENVLGSNLFDASWYSKVIKACALLEDLKNYPSGDRTLVGSKGITLSGGQKQRIALARAVYSRAPILILDDIFNGLDPMTEEIIFQSLLGDKGLLKNTLQTVVLATHAVHLLPSADSVILLGEAGDVVYQGQRESLPMELVSQRDLGDIPESEYPDRDTTARRVEDAKEADFTPVFHQTVTVQDASASDISRQTGDKTIWRYYLKTAGYRHSIFFAVLGAICMGFTPAQSLWLNAWANDTDNGKIRYYIGVYTVFFVGEIALTLLWIWHVLIFPLSASSIRLHDIQLEALMSATMTFFSNTDTGVTTNRFSQDLSLVDSELPLALIDMVEYVYNCLYKIVLIAIATVYILPIFPIMLAAFWMIQRFYLRTSRQIRYLDLETKAPLYTHFIETLSGLATVRAFGWEDGFERQNRVGLDNSQRPFFVLATIQRWLNLVLDLMVSVMGIVVAIAAVGLRGTINPGFLGLALVNVMTLGTSLKSLVSFWASLETSIGAISRIRSFSETPSEDPDHLPKASEGWVHSGGIEIKGVTASHSVDSGAVIRDVTLSIAPGEHIGICGRSGSGKSSLLSLLFRVLDASSGSVWIDGVDISTIYINQVRASINALSQEPFFLRGTIRDNLTVAASAVDSDEQRLQHVLKRVGLWPKVIGLGGLDTFLDPEEALSHGERQLFCLARAMLNPSRILILDEFTSNVDVETDRLLQKIIREHFKDRTILAVAHRLETIADFDRIVVLDKGRVVEQGAPETLLSDRHSVFRALYEASG
ncbi:unnamed protein product [Clonostachys rosea]|uniref:ABC transporter n=1 Tax=Bionectria ochroleuca TaxID=29856 RepID=A0ABY6TYI9_BIOOC|nr:unnamed protein product [Clonostachys rosea]